MARGKPVVFNKDQGGRARLVAKRKVEEAMKPKTPLPKDPPAEIANNPVAAATWRRLIALFDELEADIVSALDQRLLCEYCIGVSELASLRKLRDIYITDNNLDAVLKLDARIDRKAARIDSLADRLYLSPRSRAGVVPEGKEDEKKEKKPLKGILWDDYIRQLTESEGNDGSTNENS